MKRHMKIIGICAVVILLVSAFTPCATARYILGEGGGVNDPFYNFVVITYRDADGNIHTMTIYIHPSEGMTVLQYLIQQLQWMIEHWNIEIIRVDVYGHGTEDGQFLAGEHLNPFAPEWPQLCDLLADGAVVYLHGCDVGDNMGYLQDLANRGGVIVKAETWKTWYIPFIGYVNPGFEKTATPINATAKDLFPFIIIFH